MIRRAVLIAMLAALPGCSARIDMGNIPNDLAPGTEVNGIPYRVPKTFIAVIYEKRSDGYKEVGRQTVRLPDPDHLYVLGFESQLFSNATVEVKFNEDNTLSTASLKSESRGDEALTAVGAQLNATTAVLQAGQKADDEADLAAVNKVVAAEKSYGLAQIAVQQYEDVLANPDASALDKIKAEVAARDAKRDANMKAWEASKPLYFPDTPL